MNIFFINIFVGFIFSEMPRVHIRELSVFGYFPLIQYKKYLKIFRIKKILIVLARKYTKTLINSLVLSRHYNYNLINLPPIIKLLHYIN